MEQAAKENAQTWVQRLKEESWEAELLISTVAIFGTIQLFKLIEWATHALIDLLPPSQYLVGYGIVFIGLIAVSILVTMFIIHFLLRAYWVGLVGLNSVFPDYSIKDSAYSEIYTQKLSAHLPKLKTTIHDVDELCSVIFSAAFFMLWMYSYMSLTTCLYLWLFNKLSAYIPYSVLYLFIGVAVVVFIAYFIFMTIANLKRFHTNEKVQTTYFNFVKWGSLITLGPLYKYLLQISMTFGSNYKKKKPLIGLTVTFIVIGFAVAMLKFSDSKIPYLVTQDSYFHQAKTYSGYYLSRSVTSDFLIAPQIDADIVDSKVLRLFIPVYRYEANLASDLCDGLEEQKEREQERMWWLDCRTAYHQVYLNEKRLAPEFMGYELPETGQYGLLTYIDLSKESTGAQNLTVIKTLQDSLEWTIPFQYVNND